VDLRPASTTFRRWVSVELTAENHLMFYLPGEMGHGFQTLEDDTEVFYQVSTVFRPDAYRGLRWDDPAFGIEWPLADERIMIARDSSYPDFEL
jgi:dTDP-4-dehydrorhamnose 3,5-epimerase